MKIFLTLILIIISWNVIAQHVPYGLREKKVQKQLILKTKEFDSLILLGKASYWDEDMRMSGLGFKRGEVSKLSITFKSGTRSFYDMKLKRVTKTEISSESTIELIRNISIFSALTLHPDSLNRKPKGGISDLDEWTMLFIKQKEVTIKRSYAPEEYQVILPTNDRRLFVDLFEKLSLVIN